MNFFFNLIFVSLISSYVTAANPDCPTLVDKSITDLCEIKKCPGDYLCCPLDNFKAACLPKNQSYTKCIYDRNAFETQIFENCFKTGCPKTQICCPKVTGGSKCQDFFD